MSSRLPLNLVFSLFLALFVAACDSPQQQAVPPGTTVLVLGDSISHGTGAASGEDYPTLLAAQTGWNIINAGVPGDTSADALERLPALLEVPMPRMVLVELGGNDFLRHVPRQQTVSNLKAIIAAIRSRKATPILIAVPQPSLTGAIVSHLSDDPLYRDLAEETGTPLIEDVLAETLSQSGLKSDHVHPNAAGYRQIADDLAAALRKQGFIGKR